MMLKNSFYKIIKKETTDVSVKYDIELTADDIIYQSHFPGEPITPGACIIKIGRELLEEHFGKRLDLTGIKNAKFLSVISPLQVTEVSFIITRININEEEETIKAQISVESKGISYAKASLILRLNEDNRGK